MIKCGHALTLILQHVYDNTDLQQCYRECKGKKPWFPLLEIMVFSLFILNCKWEVAMSACPSMTQRLQRDYQETTWQ